MPYTIKRVKCSDGAETGGRNTSGLEWLLLSKCGESDGKNFLERMKMCVF
jgi:hypothetical protein